MIHGRWRRSFVVVFGVLCVALGVLAATEDAGLGLLVLPFGIALLATGLVRPAAPGAIGEVEAHALTLPDGRAVRGTFLPATRGRGVAVLVGCLGFTLAGAGLIVAGAVVLGVLTVLFFGAGSVLALRGLRRDQGLLLAPEGLVLQDGRTFVPWDAIADVRLLDQNGSRYVSLYVRDRARIETGGVSRRLMRFNRAVGAGDVTVALSVLGIDPELAFTVIARLFSEPAERAPLAAPGGEAALRRLA